MSFLKPCLTLCQIHVRPLYLKPKVIHLTEGFTVRLMNYLEMLPFCDDQDSDLNQTMVTEAYARGDFCVAAFYKEDIVAYVWRSIRATPHVNGIWVSMKEGFRYGYKAFTKPKFRQLNLQKAVSLYSDKLMIEKGIKFGIGFIESHNYPSQLSSKSCGGVIVGYAGYFTVFGKVYPFRSLGAKKNGFRFFVPKSSF